MGVDIIPKPVKTIHIKYTEITGTLDLSSTLLDEHVDIDVTGSKRLQSITFPLDQFSEGIEIFLNGRKLSKK